MDKPTVAGKAPIVTKLAAGTYYWCACGLSKNQPYCDGSHKGTSFSPKQFTLDAEKQVALCTCKATKGSPFCDGSHRTV